MRSKSNSLLVRRLALPRMSLILVSLFAALAVGGVVSVPAYAGGPVWIVDGKPLAAGKTDIGVLKAKLSLMWEDKGTKEKFEVSCEANGRSENKGGVPGTDSQETFTMTKCTLVKAAKNCALKGTTIKINALPWATTLVDFKGKIYDRITADFGPILEKCENGNFNKEFPVKGNVFIELTDGVGLVKMALPTEGVGEDTLEYEGAKAVLSGEGTLEASESGETLEVSTEAAWEQCAEGGSTTKYSEHQCLKAESGGKWSWQEVASTEKTVGHGSLVLKDTNIPIIGTVEVKCTSNDAGSVGPREYDRIETITEIKCEAGKNCEKIEETVKPLNLPWQTELFEETEKKIRDNIRATNGKGAGWSVKCKVLGVVSTDECTSEEGSAAIENKATGSELLVLATFETKSAKAKCSVGGAGSGLVEGTIAILKENGWGLRVS